MDLSRYLTRLHDDLIAAAALGDDRTQQIAASLAKATEPTLRLTLLTALSDFAKEVSAELEGSTVDARLNGDDVEIVIVHDADPDQASAQPDRTDFEQAMDDLGGNISRVTLRLVDNIKARAEEAANANGVSLNSWVGQAVRGALREQSTWSWEPPHARERRSEPQPPTATGTDGSTGTDGPSAAGPGATGPASSNEGPAERA
ncbi:toxin-antitoxin system HicB family antitoxin [Hoyosella sp. G463]|uniref:Toxin-antitoxin system HicB family antitoxin n=1 Tax=Lolliginicoccus lacisalsi TaxID=2742202 RepID=A0A927JA32_9ACTN|nr:toxin-antitoxin system HicB family antitoxin [Lolliginicoccus lacisalsi]MBD8505434.1 toxin-antitoxin system HicB family antitoxin [Lolliginicoccus lacisalsi]